MPDPVLDAWPGMGCDAPAPAGRVVLGPENALADCVVTIGAIGTGKDWPTAMRGEARSVAIAFADCRFDPAVQVARVGTQLSVENRFASSDVLFHGYRGSKTVFNVSVWPRVVLRDAADLFLDQPGIIWVTEDRRAQFHAYVHVVSNPYFYVTAASERDGRAPGEFVLDRVPPGTYEVVAWHAGLALSREHADGKVTAYRPSPAIVERRRVVVRAGETVDTTFVFAAAGRVEVR